ncbi:OmpA family protein [uncultured Polaribacter sp.]|uniref:OmpA family protein n=1 Tax=uncultured Polaribacter sp. TaxID=174711 RepID=UPI00261814EE|nr:OmpA family protein [uncultured Polaribacter sp.]
MKKTIQITTLLLFSSFVLLGQTRSTKIADDFFENLAYVKAAASYKSLAKGGATEHILKRLGDCYYFLVQMPEASETYSELFLRFPNQTPEYVFKYAQALRSVGKYNESDKMMKKFHQLAEDDSRGINFTENKWLLKALTPKNPSFKVENLKSINTVNSDFGVTEYGNTILFSSPQADGIYVKRDHSRNNKSFLDIYKVLKKDITTTEGDKSEIKPMFTNRINSKYHESSVTFSPKKDTMYFTRNNYLKGKYRKDGEGVNKLKIYRATWKKRKWANVEELPFNGNDFSTGHPSLSADGNQLYFASDRPGGLGKSDIYVVEVKADGSFGEVQNLGPTVNTEGREMFPFKALDDVLYFSSDGHFGLGALDVFATNKQKDGYTTPLNLTAPVNSKLDDFAFSINPFTKKGYLSSNREGGLGDDDIYSVEQLQDLAQIVKEVMPKTCTQNVTGIVRDKKDLKLLPGAKLVLLDQSGANVGETIADINATFSFNSLACDQNFTVIAAKEYYSENSVSFISTKDKKLNLEISLDIANDFSYNEIGQTIIKINPIYFDYDKSYIRPDAIIELNNIVRIMKKYPNMIIESGSHTDARGNSSYNEALSDRRAKSTVAYIVEKGIESSRISGRGYGEERLVNGCLENDSKTKTVKCTEEEHQSNRRTEFVIIRR